MFLNRTLLFVCCLISVPALACKPLDLNVEGIQQKLCYHKDLQALVSVSCATKKCEAETWLKKVRNKKVLIPTEDASKNHGFAYCAALGGKAVLGRTKTHSEVSLCQASDKSLVDMSTLNGP